MKRNRSNIELGIQTVRAGVLRVLLMKGTLLVFSIASFYALAFCALDLVFSFTYTGRFLAFLGLLLLSSAGAYFLLLRNILKGISDEEAALLMQGGNKNLKDSIINAVQLKKALTGQSGNFSRQLAEEYVARIEAGFKPGQATDSVKFSGVKKSFLSALLALSLLLFVLYLPEGKNSLGRLFYPLAENTAVTGEGAEDKLPPEVGDIRVRVYFPKYTGLGPRDVEQGGNAAVLRNSELVISAAANKPVTKAILRHKNAKNSGSSSMNIKGGLFPEVRLKASEDFEYRIEVIDGLGAMNKNPERHKITVINDENPKVALIFPSQDLLISPKAEIKIVYEYSDDYGVSSSNILFEKKGQSFLIPADRNRPAVSHKVSEYLWDLGALGLSFGEAVTFQIEVFDNDTEGGPKRGVSGRMKLQVPTLEKYLELTSGGKKDNSENLIGDTKNLYNRNSEFLKSLEKFKKDGKFDTGKLMGDLDMLASYLSSLFSGLAEMAQTIPADMAGKGGRNDLGLGDIAGLMKQIREAVEKGDFEKAEKLAKELSAKLSELMKKMAEARDKSRSGKISKMKGAAVDAGKEIDEILKEEQGIYSETSEEDLRNKKELLKEQTALLEKIIKMQENIILHTREFAGRLNTLKYQEAINAAAGPIGPLIANEEVALRDMKIPEILKVKERLAEIIRISGETAAYAGKLKDTHAARVEELKKALNPPVSAVTPEDGIKKELEKNLFSAELMRKDAASVSEAYGKVKEDEQEILELLKNSSRSSKGKAGGKAEKLKARQRAAKEKMKGLRKKIDELAESGADIPGMQADSEGAESSMGGAEGKLGGGNLTGAIPDEQKAVNHLENLKEAAKGLSDKLGQMPGGSGGGLTVLAPGKSGQKSGGVLGTLDGYVKIPSEKDYKPPKEFREDIMDSLKEKMPDKYKDEIEEYYRKLLR
ncbi:MAG: DUF4175 family protein [Candidatus Firestonebacteria bacterium]